MSDLDLAIKILPFISAHGGISVDEVAKEFGITTKKVSAILKLLPFTGRGQFGGELIDISVTDDGAIYVHDAQSLDVPIKLSGNQAFAILAGLAYLQNVPAFSEKEEVELLIEKISVALGVDVPAVSVATPARQMKSIEILKRAIRESESVAIDYSSATSTHSPKRTIDPIAMFVSEDRTYVNAWCHEAQSIRSFRIDRIAALELTGKKFEVSEIPDAPISGIQVLLRVSQDAISEFDALHIERSAHLADGRKEISLEVSNLEWLVRMSLAQGGDVEIVAPLEARELVATRAKAWLTSQQA